MRAQLISLDDGSTVEITKEMVVIGRGESCDVQLGHKSVSKLHCIIVRAEGILLLRDLGSTNGTRVNGERIRRAALLPNDKLNIANLRFRVHLGADVRPVHANEHTQNIDAAEVQRIIQKGRAAISDEDSDVDEMDVRPVQQNALPDVYAEGEVGPRD